MKIQYECGKEESFNLQKDRVLNSFSLAGKVVQHNKNKHRVKFPMKLEDIVCNIKEII